MDTADRISQYGIGFDSEPARPLNEELSRLTVIDAHEHLMPEHERIRRAPDAVSLFEAYPRMVLQASGMPAADLQAMTTGALRSRSAGHGSPLTSPTSASWR